MPSTATSQTKINWATQLKNLPADCGVGQFVTGLRSTSLACATPAGGSGSPCVTTALSLQYNNAGAFGCVTEWTYNSATHTVTLGAAGVFDPTAGTVKVPGTTGQLLFNNGGNLGAEDPIVSGPTAIGSAPSTNPVFVAGYDGTNIRALKLFDLDTGAGLDYNLGINLRSSASGGSAEIGVAANPLRVDPTGTTPQPVSQSGTWTTNQGTANTIGNGWPVKLTDGTHTANIDPSGNLNVDSQQLAGVALGAPSNYGTSPGAVAVPGVNAFITNTPAVSQSGTWTTNLGTTPDPCGPGQAKSYAFYDAATNGATQLVALVSAKVIFVCSYSFSSSSATANTLKLVYGTGTNCATGQTAMTPGIILQAAASTGPIGKVNPNSAGLQTAASNALCVLTNAAQTAQAEVSYVQQ